MVDINDIYGAGGNFIKTADVQRGSIMELKIRKVEPMQFGEKTKLVAELENDKSFVLNKTNAQQLASEFGTPDYTKWVGKTFKVIRTNTNYQGSNVECLRVV